MSSSCLETRYSLLDLRISFSLMSLLISSSLFFNTCYVAGDCLNGLFKWFPSSSYIICSFILINEESLLELTLMFSNSINLKGSLHTTFFYKLRSMGFDFFFILMSFGSTFWLCKFNSSIYAYIMSLLFYSSERRGL